MVRAGVPQRNIAAALGVDVRQVRNRQWRKGIRFSRRPYKESPDGLTDIIRKRAFALNMTLAELDRACGKGDCFGKSGTHRAVSRVMALKAITILGGRLRHLSGAEGLNGRYRSYLRPGFRFRGHAPFA